MERIKTDLRDGKEDLTQKGVLAEALLQYALTGRLPANASYIPSLKGIHASQRLSTRLTADIFQKTLIAEAVIVASLYSNPKTFKSFNDRVIVPALKTPLLRHQKHIALVYLLYRRARGNTKPYQKALASEHFLDTFTDGLDKINFQQLVHNTQEKYGPHTKSAPPPSIPAVPPPPTITLSLSMVPAA